MCDAIPAPARTVDGTVTGVDMNVGQVAVSDGCPLPASCTRRTAGGSRPEGGGINGTAAGS